MQEKQVQENINDCLIDDVMVDNQKSVKLLSVCFLLLFSAYNSAQNMVGQIYSQLNYDKLGNISLFTIYSVYCLNCMISPYIISKSNFKKCICISIWGYIIFLGSGIFICSCEQSPSLFYCQHSIYIYLVNILGSAMCGFCAAIIWVAASSYISTSTQHNPIQQQYLFGIFGACALGSQLFGNLSTVLLLNYFTHTLYFITLFSIAVLAASLLLLIRNIEVEEKIEYTFKQQVYQVMNRYKDKDILQCQIGFLMSGWIIGIYSSFLYKVIMNCLDLNQLTTQQVNVKTAYCFIALGAVELSLGLIQKYIFQIIDKFQMQILANFVGVINILFIFLADYFQNYTFCFVAAVTCGIYESCQTNSINLYISQVFSQSSLQQNFSLFRLIQSLGVMISIILILILNNQKNYIFLLISLLFFTLSLIIMTRFSINLKKNQKVHDSN